MQLITPNWLAPKNIHAYTTTCEVGDCAKNFTQENLRKNLLLSNKIIWLNQIHSNICVIAEEDNFHNNADAIISRQPNIAIAIKTADCLPILITHKNGLEVAAIHAGWRGLFSGIIENTCSKLDFLKENYIAWIGPGICKKCYKVDSLFKNNFLQKYPWAVKYFNNLNNQISADLAKIAEHMLNLVGINIIFQSGLCTFEEPKLFFSYRRVAQTGRIATLIWFD